MRGWFMLGMQKETKMANKAKMTKVFSISAIPMDSGEYFRAALNHTDKSGIMIGKVSESFREQYRERYNQMIREYCEGVFSDPRKYGMPNLDYLHTPEKTTMFHVVYKFGSYPKQNYYWLAQPKREENEPEDNSNG